MINVQSTWKYNIHIKIGSLGSVHDYGSNEANQTRHDYIEVKIYIHAWDRIENLFGNTTEWFERSLQNIMPYKI